MPCTPCPAYKYTELSWEQRLSQALDCNNPQANDAGSTNTLPLPDTWWAPTCLCQGMVKAAQLCLVPSTGSHALAKCPGPKSGPPHSYLRFPGQAAVPGLVGREGTLHHATVPKMIIVAKDLQQRNAAQRHTQQPGLPDSLYPVSAALSSRAAMHRLGLPLQRGW